jgi:hypothetical protein
MAPMIIRNIDKKNSIEIMISQKVLIKNVMNKQYLIVLKYHKIHKDSIYKLLVNKRVINLIKGEIARIHS